MIFDLVDKRWNKLWYFNVIYFFLNILIIKNINKYLFGWERYGFLCFGGCFRVL